MTGSMSDRRTYGDPCGIARALDVVGERWAVLVVRELVLGPKRFTDLRKALPGSSPAGPTERLRDLEQAGVGVRRTLPPPAGARVRVFLRWRGAAPRSNAFASCRQHPSPAPPRGARGR